MATGDNNDIIARVKLVLPRRWFSFVAPIRDAVLGGLADSTAWCYSLIVYAQLQTRLATATGPWLDIWSMDFLYRFLPRKGMTDDAFRAVIQATILQERVTRSGMTSMITRLTGAPPSLIEPWNTGDCGAYGVGAIGYGRVGYWGSINLPNQFFMKVNRAGIGPTGVPTVAGYKGYTGGYGVGAIEWGGVDVPEIGITDDIIRQLILMTKPSGSIVWLQIF